MGKIKEDVPSSAKLIAVVGSQALDGTSSNDIILNEEPSVKNNMSENGANNSENGLKFTISRALNNDKIQKAEEMEKELKGAYDGNEFKKQKHRLFRKGWAVFFIFRVQFRVKLCVKKVLFL